VTPPDPAALPGRYYGEHLLELRPDGTAYHWQAGALLRDHYEVTSDTVTFTGESCSGTPGSYHWTRSNDALTLAKVDDSCEARASVLTNAFTRSETLPFVTVQHSGVIDQPDYAQAAVDAAGDIYATDGTRGGGHFYKYHPDGTPVALTPDPTLTFTIGITVDSKGNIYVANFDDATIHKYDSSGRPLLTWKVDHGLVGPSGLTHDAHDNIIVPLHRTHDHYIEKYSPDGALLATWATLGGSDGQVGAGPSSGPEMIAADRDGNSYVTDPVNHRIVSFAPDGTFRRNFAGTAAQPLERPDLVAVDNEGNVYTESNLEIWKFDPSGALVGRWFTPVAGALVIDPQDRLLVVDSGIWVLGFPTA
jgi:sugar lactone lactonase YvrE